MGRKRYSEEGLELLAIKLPKSLIADLTAQGDLAGKKKGTIARDLLLLGYSVYQTMQAMGIAIEFDTFSYPPAQPMILGETPIKELTIEKAQEQKTGS